MMNEAAAGASRISFLGTVTCPSCGHLLRLHNHQSEVQDLPAGVKFDPNDIEILEYLEAKVGSDKHEFHHTIDDFIHTLEGEENGICYTHPEKLPGVKKDGVIRHFFHRPSKAYTTGTRKRRKVDMGEEGGGETRWHKTGKTRAVCVEGRVKGHKKILVLYANYGRQRKPEKTNWVIHQYHLGSNEEEREGEVVVSKVFYQTQPRQCTTSNTTTTNNDYLSQLHTGTTTNMCFQSSQLLDYYNNRYVYEEKSPPPPECQRISFSSIF